MMRCLKVFQSCCTTVFLSTSCGTAFSSKNLIKQSVVMNKFFNRQKKQKKFTPGSCDGIVSVDLAGTERPTSHVLKRRIHVLNKLFMEYITDIMATSSASTDLLNLNIEVTQVSMSNDYKTLRVFWLSREIPSIDEQKLLENAKILRHELSQLRIISSIPQILFVKDKRQLLINEVEEILKTADMGVANCDSEAELEDEESELPPKSTSVFGLHRAKIMEKVRRDMRKHCFRQTACQPKDSSLSQSHVKYKHLIRKFVNKAS